MTHTQPVPYDNRHLKMCGATTKEGWFTFNMGLFEGVCLTTVILAPGASEVGLGAAALDPLCAHWGLWAQSSARSFFVRRRAT